MSAQFIESVLIVIAGIAALVLVTGILYVGYLIWVTQEYLGEIQRKRFRK